jgi:hypothetical protein
LPTPLPQPSGSCGHGGRHAATAGAAAARILQARIPPLGAGEADHARRGSSCGSRVLSRGSAAEFSVSLEDLAEAAAADECPEAEGATESSQPHGSSPDYEDFSAGQLAMAVAVEAPVAAAAAVATERLCGLVEVHHLLS